MNRSEFTDKITQLIRQMIAEGERPIGDYLKRSPEEQNRLFKLKLSKCDGYNITSGHQRGTALDIYFLSDDGRKLVDPNKGWEYWHSEWEKLGGLSIIEWDKGHFEG